MAQLSVQPTLSEIADTAAHGAVGEPEFRALVDFIAEIIAGEAQRRAA